MKADRGMTVWIGSAAHRLAAGPSCQPCHDLSSIARESTASVVIEANSAPGRSSRNGLRLLIELRRRWSSRAGVLVYSFEARKTLARAFAILSESTPGSVFLRAP